MSTFLRILVTAAALAALSGCATLFTGTRDTIAFDSAPRGALVMIDGVDVGRTPVTVPVKRSLGERIVTLRMEGYVDRTFVLGREFNLVSVLNLSNVFGWGVDAASGALLKYSERSYHMEMERRMALGDFLEVDEVLLLTEVERGATGHFVIPGSAGGVALIDPTTLDVVILR